MKALMLVAVACLGSAPVVAAGATQPTVDELAEARKARDQADVQALRGLIERAQHQASQEHSFDGYLRLSQLETWMCEAAEDGNDSKLAKQSAEAGIAAAENAVKLKPNSSEAHRLLADSLGELIPYVFAGGPRYGPRSTREAEKAIQLDPNNAAAYVNRARSYFFAPSAFGGNKEKAIERLQKAIALEPASDTAHIWLAVAYQGTAHHDDAMREIDVALRLDPDRNFARHVRAQIAQGQVSVH
ncbi:MAG TPA: tetratricopeptide repeat protein [Terriglobia bacterium]|nr:tetratricopeptide repeat protein [Terriglobia bacterium]